MYWMPKIKKKNYIAIYWAMNWRQVARQVPDNHVFIQVMEEVVVEMFITDIFELNSEIVTSKQNGWNVKVCYI